ncbi:MAG: hypothetical protein Fur0042_12630 [Cyanophyceae cyanobacterium]
MIFYRSEIRPDTWCAVRSWGSMPVATIEKIDRNRYLATIVGRSETSVTTSLQLAKQFIEGQLNG